MVIDGWEIPPMATLPMVLYWTKTRRIPHKNHKRFVRKLEGWWNVSLAKPIPSMSGIFTCIYHTNQPNVGKYTIHGSYGKGFKFFRLQTCVLHLDSNPNSTSPTLSRMWWVTAPCWVLARNVGERLAAGYSAFWMWGFSTPKAGKLESSIHLVRKTSEIWELLSNGRV